jgi:hypothetical protein
VTARDTFVATYVKRMHWLLKINPKPRKHLQESIPGHPAAPPAQSITAPHSYQAMEFEVNVIITVVIY